MGVDLLPAISGNKEWSPDKWGPRHRLIVSMHVAGLRNYEIARTLNLSESHISIILNDPRAALEVEDLSRTVADKTVDTLLRLKLYANEALSEIVDEMRNAPKAEVRQRAAFGILDRAGYSPAALSGQTDKGAGITQEFIDRMEEALSESGEIEANYEILGVDVASPEGDRTATSEIKRPPPDAEEFPID